MAGANETDGLGVWSGADLGATARSAAGAGADAGVPDDVRFRSTIAKLIRRRKAVSQDPPGDLATSVFLLEPSPPTEAEQYSPRRVPCLDDGTHDIGGRVWFVGAGPGSGKWVAASFEDDDDLFNFITDDLACGAKAAILHKPQHPEPHIRYYPNGFDDLDEFKEIPIAGASVTIETVTAAIDNTHAQMMITPDAQPDTMKLWEKAAKWWPFKVAEKRAQGYLEIALNTAFPTCIIRSEQPLNLGRLDIAIVEKDPVNQTVEMQHGVLELKVLRSYGSTGIAESEQKTRDWVESGVKQASAYRDDKSAPWAALVCFDMRKTDEGQATCFAHVNTLAGHLSVHLRRWFLYASSKELRNASTAA